MTIETGKSETEKDRPGDPPPRAVLDDAKAVFATRSRGDLAAVVFDSLLDGNGSADDHILRFEHSRASIEVRVSYAEQNTGLDGVILGLPARRAALHLGDGDLAMVADVEDGRFAFHPVGHGLVKLSFEDGQGGPIMWTDWFRI